MLTNQQEKKKKHQTIPQDAYELLSNVLALFDKGLTWNMYCNGQIQVSHGPFVPKLTKDDQAVSPCLETMYSSCLMLLAQQQYHLMSQAV